MGRDILDSEVRKRQMAKQNLVKITKTGGCFETEYRTTFGTISKHVFTTLEDAQEYARQMNELVVITGHDEGFVCAACAFEPVKDEGDRCGECAAEYDDWVRDQYRGA